MKRIHLVEPAMEMVSKVMNSKQARTERRRQVTAINGRVAADLIDELIKLRFQIQEPFTTERIECIKRDLTDYFNSIDHSQGVQVFGPNDK